MDKSIENAHLHKCFGRDSLLLLYSTYTRYASNMVSKFVEPLFDFEEELMTNSDEELLSASQHFEEVGAKGSEL